MPRAEAAQNINRRRIEVDEKVDAGKVGENGEAKLLKTKPVAGTGLFLSFHP